MEGNGGQALKGPHKESVPTDISKVAKAGHPNVQPYVMLVRFVDL